MKTKNLISIAVVGLMICAFSTGAFAETFSVSYGIPMQYNFDGEWSGGDKVEADGLSGGMLHVKFPIMLGLGLESYVTIIKPPTGFDDMQISTSLLDVFYLTPIPLINVTIGVGVGNISIDCTTSTGSTCEDSYEAGLAYQWWGQLGYSFFPFLDVHLSYHDVTAKVKGKSGNSDLNFGGTVIAVGAAIYF